MQLGGSYPTFILSIIPPEGVMIIFHIGLNNVSRKDSSLITKKSSHIFTIIVATSKRFLFTHLQFYHLSFLVRTSLVLGQRLCLVPHFIPALKDRAQYIVSAQSILVDCQKFSIGKNPQSLVS